MFSPPSGLIFQNWLASLCREQREAQVIGKRYRIKESTLGMIQRDGHHVALTIPGGSVIVVTGGPLDGNRLVDVTWNGEALMMFTQDLRTRGEFTTEEI